jgi:putative FmdB family regulatory protein
MPTYEYQCKACEHIFEEFLPLKDRKNPEKSPCPECGEKQVKHEIISLPGTAVDTAHRIDGKATGGFRDVMQRISGSQGIKGTHAEKYFKNRYGL